MFSKVRSHLPALDQPEIPKGRLLCSKAAAQAVGSVALGLDHSLGAGVDGMWHGAQAGWERTQTAKLPKLGLDPDATNSVMLREFSQNTVPPKASLFSPAVGLHRSHW
jgi:hypothetical protein